MADAPQQPQAVVGQDGRVHLLDPGGRPVTVAPGEDLRLALQQGYSLEPIEAVQHRADVREQEGPAGMAKTAAEGLARGATVGLSDVALGAIGGEEYRQNMLLRQEANPVLGTAAEFGGMAIPAFLSGGESLLARGAAMTPAGLLGSAAGMVERGVARGLAREGAGLAERALVRGAATAAGGALEGGAWGLGTAVSDAYLNGEPITAEKVLASAGETALWGGALGGVFGAGSTWAGEKLAGAAGRLAKKQQAEQLGFDAAAWKKVHGRGHNLTATEQKMDEVLNEARNYTFQSGELKGQKIAGPFKKIDEIAPRLDAAVNEVDAQIGGIRREVQRAIDTSKPHLAPSGTDAYEAAIEATGLRHAKTPAMKEALADIERELAPVKAMGARARFDDLEAIRLELNRIARPAKPAGGGLAAPPPKSAEWMLKAERGLDGYLDQATQKVLAGPTSALDELGLRNMAYLRDGMRDMTVFRRQYAGATPAEATEIALGRRPPMDGSAPLPPVRVHVEPDGSMALNDGRHRMTAAAEAGADSMVADVVMYDASGYPVSEVTRPVSINGVHPAPGDADAFERYLALQKTSSNLKTARDVATNKALAGKAGSASKATDYGMTTGVGVAALLSGNIGASPFGVLHYGLPAAAGALAVTRLARTYGHGVLAAMAEGVAKFSQRMNASAAALAGVRPISTVTRPILTETAKQLTERFQATANQVDRAANDPEALREMIADRIGDIVPVNRDLAAAMADTIAGDAQYLATKLPRGYGRGASQLAPMKLGPMHFPKGEVKAFMAAADALSRPDQVIEELVKGRLPREALEALEARRPAIFDELRQQVAAYVSEREDELPYKRRVLLSVAFKFDGDWSLQPANLAAIQQATVPPEPEPPPASPRAPTANKVADMMATPYERVLQ